MKTLTITDKNFGARPVFFAFRSSFSHSLKQKQKILELTESKSGIIRDAAGFSLTFDARKKTS